MDEIIIEKDSDLTEEARFHAVREVLKKGRCIVDFTKVDGTSRSMICTLNEELMNVVGRVISDDVVDITTNFNVVTVWSLENSAWRAMRVMNIQKVKLLPDSWTVTVEEDPETGEIILPLPPDMLAAAGWKDGDTLEWEEGTDGGWFLKKV